MTTHPTETPVGRTHDADRQQGSRAAARLLEQAAHDADAWLSEARTQADAMVADARTQVAELIRTAQADAELARSTARAEADRLVSDARTEADGLRRAQESTVSDHEAEVARLAELEKESRDRVRTLLKALRQQLGD
jgi:vacuolar-type H+-ATPase subunit H